MLTGVILAGGQNRRMNGNIKAFLTFGHESILERQIGRMQTICRELVIVTNQPERFSHLNKNNNVKIITDDVPGKGPLSGIHAVRSHASGENLWVVACDMPYISPRAAKVLLDQKKTKNYDAAVPVIDGRNQPLHGVYARKTLPVLSDLLAKGEHKVRSFLDRINWLPVQEELFDSNDIDSRFALNLNTPEEYEQALKYPGSDQ